MFERTRYVVGLYEIDRAYGGLEEGGRWYDCGVLRRTLCITAVEETAYSYTQPYPR